MRVISLDEAKTDEIAGYLGGVKRHVDEFLELGCVRALVGERGGEREIGAGYSDEGRRDADGDIVRESLLLGSVRNEVSMRRRRDGLGVKDRERVFLR